MFIVSMIPHEPWGMEQKRCMDDYQTLSPSSDQVKGWLMRLLFLVNIPTFMFKVTAWHLINALGAGGGGCVAWISKFVVWISMLYNSN